jgi:pimeloyl-ACP methyl ester carboxylesterase
VARLVLANPLVRARDGLYPRTRRLLSPWVRPLARRLLGFRPFARWLAANSVDSGAVPESLIEGAMASDRQVMMGDAMGLLHLDLTPDLRRLSMPVLLMGADRDAVVRPAQLRLAATCVPQAATYEFQRCGHCPPLEQPHLFLERLEDFLTDGPGTRS